METVGQVVDKSLVVITISRKFDETQLETVGGVVDQSLVVITISWKFEEKSVENGRRSCGQKSGSDKNILKVL